MKLPYTKEELIEIQAIGNTIVKQDFCLIDKYNITPDYFNAQLYQDEERKIPAGYGTSTIWKFICDYRKQYNSDPSLLTMQGKYQDFNFELSNDDFKYLAKELIEQHQETVVRLFSAAASDEYTKKGTQAYIHYVSNNVEKLETNSRPTFIENDLMHDGIIECWRQYVKDRENPEKMLITTGLKELDDKIGGWKRGGELAIIQAPTGQGKSQILIKMLYEACNCGFNVCLYEPEMSKQEVALRLVSHMTHISNYKLTKNKEIDSQYGIQAQEQAKVNRGNFDIITALDMPDATPSKLRDYCRYFHIDLLAIDGIMTGYINDETTNEKTADYVRLGNVCTSLMNISAELNMPIIASVQAQRGRDELTNDTVSGSYKISQIASMMFSLKNVRGDKTNTMILKTTKNRLGDDDIELVYNVDLDKQVWQYIGESYDNDTIDNNDKPLMRKSNTDPIQLL